MKKVLAFLLAVMMLAGVSCAWAEGTTEEAVEITFRDIAFGATWGEFRDNIDVLKDEYPQGFGSAWEGTPYRVEDIVLYGNYNYNIDTANSPLLKDVIFCSNGLDYYYRVKSLMVAGYQTNASEVFFVRPVVVGSIVTDDDSAIFYAAYYEFGNCDDAMETDLNTKLSGIYGTPESITDEQGNNLIVWYGANDTEVTLFRDGTTIRLVYAWRGAEALIDEALAIAKANQPPAKDVSGDSSGL